MSNESKWQQIAAGLKSANVPAPIALQLKVALETDRARAEIFYKKSIFAMLNPTEKENLARALTCQQYAYSKIDAATVDTLYQNNKKLAPEELKRHITMLAQTASQAPVDAVTIRNIIPPAPPLSEWMAITSHTMQPQTERRLNAVMEIASAGSSGGRSNLAYRLTNISRDTVNKVPLEKRGAASSDGLVSKTTSTISETVNDIKIEFGSLSDKNLLSLRKIARQADSAYGNFSACFKDAGDAQNARLKMISKIATTVLSEIPIVGSVLSTVAETCIGLLKYDAEIPQTDYQRGPPRVDTSAIGKLVTKVKNQVDDVTRLGVRSETIPTCRSIQEVLDRQFSGAFSAGQRELEATLNDMFRMNGDAAAQARGADARIAPRLAAGMFGSHLQNAVVDDIKQDGKEIKKGLHNYFNKRFFAFDDNLEKYIELMLWAHYFEQLATPKKFNADFEQFKKISVTIPDPVILRLDQLGIVQKKNGANSTAVVATGKIPYEGHANHKIGVLMFFKWYAGLNPFYMIGSASFTTDVMQNKINQYITKIYTAILENRTNPTIGRSGIADIKPVAAAHDAQVAEMSRIMRG